MGLVTQVFDEATLAGLGEGVVAIGQMCIRDRDYREHMKRILKKRSRLAPVRLESERPLSRTVKGLSLIHI